MEELCLQQHFPPAYNIKSTLLNHTKVTEKFRARLYSWLSEESCKQNLSRYTYCLTCIYIDLYFMKGNAVKLANYQNLGLAALVLACKQNEIQCILPQINKDLISLNSLWHLELQLIKGLGFDLKPPNYIDMLNELSTLWDTFCSQRKRYQGLYMREQKECYLRLKRLYEVMDCLYLCNFRDYLVKRILNYPLFTVVLSLFYLFTYFQISKKGLEAGLEQLNESLSFKGRKSKNFQEYNSFFRSFLKQNNISQEAISPELLKIVNVVMELPDLIPTQKKKNESSDKKETDQNFQNNNSGGQKGLNKKENVEIDPNLPVPSTEKFSSQNTKETSLSETQRNQQTNERRRRKTDSSKEKNQLLSNKQLRKKQSQESIKQEEQSVPCQKNEKTKSEKKKFKLAEKQKQKNEDQRELQKEDQEAKRNTSQRNLKQKEITQRDTNMERGRVKGGGRDKRGQAGLGGGRDKGGQAELGGGKSVNAVDLPQQSKENVKKGDQDLTSNERLENEKKCEVIIRPRTYAQHLSIHTYNQFTFDFFNKKVELVNEL